VEVTARAAASGGKRFRTQSALPSASPLPSATIPQALPSSSKWNPIEHRLFSQISKNWAGEPLTDIDKILKFIRTTKTESGLTVGAYLMPENYDTGIKISDAQMRQLNLVPHEILGRWNYTVRPAQNVN
jgi:hypothetical protein